VTQQWSSNNAMKKKLTAPGIPRRSPIQVLTRPDPAWLPRSDEIGRAQGGMAVSERRGHKEALYRSAAPVATCEWGVVVTELAHECWRGCRPSLKIRNRPVFENQIALGINTGRGLSRISVWFLMRQIIPPAFCHDSSFFYP
jgi:hypothetical protein